MKIRTVMAWVAAVSAGAVCNVAWSHSTLQTSVPARGAVLTSSPAAVTLHFNENVERDFTTIKVIDAAGLNLVTGKTTVDKADRKTVLVPISTLKPGQYKVQWSAVGPDGHRRTGDYVFVIK